MASMVKCPSPGSQCVLFFTDGQKQAIIRSGSYRTPDGTKVKAKTVTDRRKAFNFYFNKIVLPWFKDYIKPYHIEYVTKYLRGGSMCYWGAVISRLNVDNVAPIKRTIMARKFDETKKAAYINLILEGKGRMMAAREVGINVRTVERHMKSSKKFKQAVSQAETEVNDIIENALYEAAKSGNVTAIQVWLYNRSPDRWNDKRNIQIAGKDGGPIEVKDVGVRNLTDAQLIEIIERNGGLGATPEEPSS